MSERFVDVFDPLQLEKHLDDLVEDETGPIRRKLFKQAGVSIPVFMADDVRESLSPLFSSQYSLLDSPEELSSRAGQEPPKFVMVGAVGREEDALYAQAVAHMRLCGWNSVPVIRFFGDFLQRILTRNRTTSVGSLPRLNLDFDRYRLYAIVCTGRSGSTYLCDLLTNTGVCGYPAEHLREPLIHCIRNDLLSVPDYVTSLVAHQSTPNRVFGTKLISRFLLEFESDIADLVPPSVLRRMRIVALSRRDKVAQAASVLRARKTGRWHSVSRDGRFRSPRDKAIDVVIDEQALKEGVHEYYENLVRQRRLDTLISDLFDEDQVYRLEYEDLVENPGLHLERIIEHIGLTPGTETPVGSRHSKIVSNDDIYDRLKVAIELDSRSM